MGTISEKSRKKSIETICAQADQSNDPYGAHVMPIYQTSTFTFKDAEAGRRFFAHEPGGATHSYSRLGNPSVQKAEQVIADLEAMDLDEKAEGMMFGSGMAAITTGLMSIAAGKRILSQETLYGCTSQFLEEEAGKFGIAVTFFNPNEPGALEMAFADHDDIALVFLETISNPTMRVCDLQHISNYAHQEGAYVMADNTFATPWHIRPFNFGVDLIAHSTTKFLNGHGTTIGGILVGRHGFFEMTEMHTWRKNFGGTAGPFDAWLTLMGIKTFPLRMRAHNENGIKVARFLKNHPAIESIAYPGLADHPDKEIIDRVMINGYGGMIAFELKGGMQAGIDFINRVKIPSLAVSLGNVDSLIQHPASMTHAVVTPENKEKAGITDGLIRLSVGIESAGDIIADLEQALM